MRAEAEFDYIVVGAGSAGCVVASRLSEDPSCSVLLLEAGGKAKHPNISIPAAFSELFETKFDWAYYSEPEEGQQGRKIFLPRGKGLGGSSSINAMVYLRGNDQDFADWVEHGAAGWSAAEVLPYFKKSERNEQFDGKFHGTDGPMNVTFRYTDPITKQLVDGAMAVGHERVADFNSDTQEGVGILQATQKNGRRVSVADAFIRPHIGKRKNLTVITGALVHRVVLNNGAAVGVEYSTGKKVSTANASSEVIVSGGAYATPQILQLSGIGDPEHLAKIGVDVTVDQPGVGRNLIDHPCAPISWELTDAASGIGLSDAKKPRYLAEWLLRHSGKLTSNIMEGNVLMRSDPSLPAPDLQMPLAPVFFSDHGRITHDNPTVTMGPVLLQPESRGTVLAQSNDPAQLAAVSLNFYDNPSDMRRMVFGMNAALEVVHASGFGKALGKIVQAPDGLDSDHDIEHFIRAKGEHLYHPVGTARIGAPEDGVVDPELRVYGVERLRVADASVMPKIVRANTNAATIMIGERAADFIRAG
jgi:choline dehydrogenase